MPLLKGIRSVIYPARNLQAAITEWTQILGKLPNYRTPDFATFNDGGLEIGLMRLPWVDQPLVMWKVDNIVEAQSTLVRAGARAMGEVSGGSIAELGSAEVVNGNPITGVVDMPGRRLAVLKLADGTLLGIWQDLPNTRY